MNFAIPKSNFNEMMKNFKVVRSAVAISTRIYSISEPQGTNYLRMQYSSDPFLGEETFEGPLWFPTYAKCGAYLTIWATLSAVATAVTVTLYTDAGASEPLSSGVATQCAGTYQWYWSTSNITTQPTTLTHFRVRFEDNFGNKAYRDVYFGGTQDSILRADRMSQLAFLGRDE